MRIVPRLALAFALLAAPLASTAARAEAAAPPTAPSQVKAPLTKGAFVLFEYDIKDLAAFNKVAADIRGSLQDFKGEFVMREKVESLFGGAPTNLSVISFPTVADARAWVGSPGLTALRPERDKAASVRSYLVEKLD